MTGIATATTITKCCNYCEPERGGLGAVPFLCARVVALGERINNLLKAAAERAMARKWEYKLTIARQILLLVR
jgi:hypothetical protein